MQNTSDETLYATQLKHPHIIESETRETLPLPVTCLILCGGKSKRMGRAKAFLPFAGKTIIEHIIKNVRPIFNETFLVANETEPYSDLEIDVIKDILPYRGPLGGILSGLLVANNSHAFVVACDMPLITVKLIRQIAIQRHNSDIVVLSHQQGIEPLIGIYSKNCIKPLEESLFDGNVKLQDFIADLKATTFPFTEENNGKLPAYFNINTPQDYSKVITTPN